MPQKIGDYEFFIAGFEYKKKKAYTYCLKNTQTGYEEFPVIENGRLVFNEPALIPRRIKRAVKKIEKKVLSFKLFGLKLF